MGLFGLLQPGRAEAPSGGGSHAATPQIRRPCPAPSQTAQDGGVRPRSNQHQGQNVPGCRRHGNDHQRQFCECGAGDGGLEVVLTGFSSRDGSAEITQRSLNLPFHNLFPPP